MFSFNCVDVLLTVCEGSFNCVCMCVLLTVCVFFLSVCVCTFKCEGVLLTVLCVCVLLTVRVFF